MLDSAIHNYKYPIYCTLKQANKMGAHIVKDSKAMPILFWDFLIFLNDLKISKEQYAQLNFGDKLLCRRIPFLKTYYVFNLSQTNLEEKQPDKMHKIEESFSCPIEDVDSTGMFDIPSLDNVIENQSWVCKINCMKSSQAFFSPSKDQIVVPLKQQFKKGKTSEDIYKDGQEFYSTLLHEMIHSTGTPDRLNRKVGGKFGDSQYAIEELVAELGAARCGQSLGFDKKILDNNAAYLDNWISCLKKDPTFILSLMQDVDKASRMIMSKLAI